MEPDNELHLFALHYVYLPRINSMIEEFKISWKNHSLRTEKNCTPLQLWTEGFYRLSTTLSETNLIDCTENAGIDYDGQTPELETSNNVQIPGVDISLCILIP